MLIRLLKRCFSLQWNQWLKLPKLSSADGSSHKIACMHKLFCVRGRKWCPYCPHTKQSGHSSWHYNNHYSLWISSSSRNSACVTFNSPGFNLWASVCLWVIFHHRNITCKIVTVRYDNRNMNYSLERRQQQCIFNLPHDHNFCKSSVQSSWKAWRGLSPTKHA